MKSPSKIIGWMTTLPFLIGFVTVLLICHPLIVVGARVGRPCYIRAQDILYFLLVANLRLWGTRFEVALSPMLPVPGRPVVVISNHQSMFDIPVIKWWLRMYYPRFVSKKELGRWIPSVSAVLRFGWSALIDRSDSRQAIREIKRFALSVREHGDMAVIFPEGTRARDGVMKKFKPGGLATLLAHIPDAIVVPVAITGSWELFRYKLRPIPFGVRFSLRVLDPVEREGRDEKGVMEEAERRIREVVHGPGFQARDEFRARKEMA